MFTFIIQHTNHSVIRLRPCPGVPDAPYWVLSTDYHSYSLVYSCSNYFGLFHIDFAWILARTRVLSEQVISELHDELAAAGVNLNRLTVSDQTGCDVMTWGAICKMGKKKGGTKRSWILWTASETPSTFCWRRMFSWFYTAVSGITQDSSNVDSHLTVLRLNIKESWKPMWPYNHFVSALSIMS